MKIFNSLIDCCNANNLIQQDVLDAEVLVNTALTDQLTAIQNMGIVLSGSTPPLVFLVAVDLTWGIVELLSDLDAVDPHYSVHTIITGTSGNDNQTENVMSYDHKHDRYITVDKYVYHQEPLWDVLMLNDIDANTDVTPSRWKFTPVPGQDSFLEFTLTDGHGRVWFYRMDYNDATTEISVTHTLDGVPDNSVWAQG